MVAPFIYSRGRSMFLRCAMVLCLALIPLGAIAQSNVDPLQSVLDGAQSPDPTLEDLRLSLQSLDQELQGLRGQLVSTGQVAPGIPFDAGTLARLDAIEARIRTLTGQVERIQFDVRRVAEDGGRRIADMDFRLTELEGGDTSFVAPATPLGGAVGNGASTQQGVDAPQVALTEQAAFDAAKALYDAGDFAGAAPEFERFLETFPGGPLTTEARYFAARSYEDLGQPRAAAINYLNAFSASPEGANAADALRRLAGALGQIGQMTEACLTYDEALARFGDEGDAYVTMIVNDKQALGCF